MSEQGLPRRNCLILVRAGDRSLHPQWLAPEREWDLAVSYYGDFPERYRGQYDLLHCFKGSKWQGICNFLDTHADLVARYEWLWLPDDDLFCDAATIDRFFAICRAADFTIAQPALTPWSYTSWPITVQDERLLLRQTDFVEIMAPCFAMKHFHLFRPTLSENTSGWGLEWLWSRIAQQSDVFRIGIVDAAPVFHTRPVGSAGHGGSASAPRAEYEDLLRRHGLTPHEPRVIGYVPREAAA